MTRRQFKDWLDKLKRVWETRNPKAVIDLCAEKFLWYETPFSKPLKTKKQLLEEWKSVLNQEKIFISYEILSINKNVGIAQWRANFTRLPSKEKATLEGIFKVSLNEQGECTEFHQWYNSKE
jgi:hypothetical protein